MMEAITQTVTVLLFSSAFHSFHSMETVIDLNIQFLSESVGI